MTSQVKVDQIQANAASELTVNDALVVNETLAVTGATTLTGATTVTGALIANTFSSSGATITGGSVTGITDLAVADGGTGASTAAAARTALDVPSNSEAILDTIIDAAGDLIYGTAADTPARLAIGTAGQTLQVNAAGTAPAWVADRSARNLIINGAFEVAQRGASFTSATTYPNSDDAYLLDRWTLLSDGNDIVDVTQNTATVPTGGLYTCALDVETANKKFGIIQFIEQKNCYRAFGSTVSLSFKARKGASNATVDTMRAVVLAWDSTADTVTSDVVSAWNVSGTNPTLVANWTAENTATDLTLTNSFQTFKIEGISADTASAKNLAVFLYYNDADGTVGDFIYITDVQLELGSVATEFERRDIADEVTLCQRYFEKSYDHATVPGSATSGGALFPLTAGSSTITYQFPIVYKTRKRVTPTVTFYSVSTGTPGVWQDSGGTERGVTSSQSGESGATMANNSGVAVIGMLGHWVASAEL
jgi:hypothetical protein